MRRHRHLEDRSRSRVAFVLACLVGLTGSISAQDSRFDPYGGLTALPAEATGWFRIEDFEGRHLLVTPAGHGYLALGVNHIAALGRGDTGFFANEYSTDWNSYFRQVLKPQLALWNMNSLGYDGPQELQDRVPFFATIRVAPIEKHRSHPVVGQAAAYQFPDVFDPEWQRDVTRRIESHCDRFKHNRFLIGYLWTDTPTWDLVKTRGLRGTDWVSAIRQLPKTAPGKLRYVDFLSSRYRGHLRDLNTIYGLNLPSLELMADQSFERVAIGRHSVREDDEAFLRLIAKQFYQVVGQAQRRGDPHHLVFGDRYLAGDAPAAVLKAAAPWIDAVSVQPGDRYTKLYPPSTRFPGREIDRLHRVAGKPVLICDHAISYPTPDAPRTIFEQMPSRAEAARATESFLRQAFSKQYLLGYLRCQYVNRPAQFGRGLRQGLVNELGEPDELIVNTYRHTFSQALADLEAGRRSRNRTNDSGSKPEIQLWYGDTQRFGHIGHPQRWVNVLGHVEGGQDRLTLTYSLNGGPHRPLSVREDFKRIARDGDFNVEIDRRLLRPGENELQLRATAGSGRTAERRVSLHYVDDQRRWPLPYEIDWSRVERVDDVAQVIDGKWELTAGGVRSIERYYDRVIAFGDASWSNYEVSTSVTFHAFTPPSTIPNTTNVTHAAIALRWPGHDPDGKQPTVKWFPLGATAEFRLTWNLDQCRWRVFDGKREFYVESDRRRQIELEKTYRMKHRVETLADTRSRYRVKLWPIGEAEPEMWDLERYETGDLKSGSALLLTHHADATFGNVVVRPLNSLREESQKTKGKSQTTVTTPNR